MQYKPYGADGPQISRLGFGVMRLPLAASGEYADVDFQASTCVLRAAFAAGCNFVDSHHGYHGGHSEVAIGKALRGWRGQRVYVQTKTPWYREEPVEYFERLLDEALEKLGVDSIDYLLHHAMTMTHWQTRGKAFIKFTDRALARGLIRHRGFSSHETPANVRAFIDTGEFAVMLVSYNWMNPQMRDVIAYAADKGMGVTVMNPVGGGALAASTRQILDLLPTADSAAEVSLRYVLATPGVTCALSGMGTLEQVAENASIAGLAEPLTAAEQTAMQSRLRAIEREAAQFCTACGYCMPCEHGVDIPGNLKLLNQVRFFGLRDWAARQYRRLRERGDADRSAAACRRCGACEPKCPNNVAIIELLAETRALLERDDATG